MDYWGPGQSARGKAGDARDGDDGVVGVVGDGVDAGGINCISWNQHQSWNRVVHIVKEFAMRWLRDATGATCNSAPPCKILFTFLYDEDLLLYSQCSLILIDTRHTMPHTHCLVYVSIVYSYCLAAHNNKSSSSSSLPLLLYQWTHPEILFLTWGSKDHSIGKGHNR